MKPVKLLVDNRDGQRDLKHRVYSIIKVKIKFYINAVLCLKIKEYSTNICMNNIRHIFEMKEDK